MFHCKMKFSEFLLMCLKSWIAHSLIGIIEYLVYYIPINSKILKKHGKI